MYLDGVGTADRTEFQAKLQRKVVKPGFSTVMEHRSEGFERKSARDIDQALCSVARGVTGDTLTTPGRALVDYYVKGGRSGTSTLGSPT